MKDNQRKDSLLNQIFQLSIKTMENLLKDARQCPVKYRNAYDELRRLSGLGLENSANGRMLTADAKRYESQQAAQAKLDFLREAWCWLGNDMVPVDPDGFKTLLESNGLVCGRISEYRGMIPEETLKTYADAERNCRCETVAEQGYLPKYATNHLEDLNLPFLDNTETGWFPPEEAFMVASAKEGFSEDAKDQYDALIFSYSIKALILIYLTYSGGGICKTILNSFKRIKNEIMN